jgi:hypothetical protein
MAAHKNSSRRGEIFSARENQEVMSRMLGRGARQVNASATLEAMAVGALDARV